MARPVKARRICGIPGRMRFGPLEAGTGPGTDQIEAGTGPESDQIISLTLEEYERSASSTIWAVLRRNAQTRWVWPGRRFRPYTSPRG